MPINERIFLKFHEEYDRICKEMCDNRFDNQIYHRKLAEKKKIEKLFIRVFGKPIK